MGCNCGKVKKFESRCPVGFHRDIESNQCLDAHGNPYIPSKQPDKKEPRKGGLHDVQRFKGKGEAIEFNEPEKKKSYLTPEQSQKIKQNMAKVRSYFAKMKQLKGNKGIWGPILIPITTSYVAYDFCKKKSAQLEAKAIDEQQKKFAESYSKTMDEIIEQVPDIDLDSVSPEEAKKLIDKYQSLIKEKVDSLKEDAIQQGKHSPEHARYRAYVDYLKMFDMQRVKVAVRMKNMGYTVDEARAKFK